MSEIDKINDQIVANRMADGYKIAPTNPPYWVDENGYMRGYVTIGQAEAISRMVERMKIEQVVMGVAQ